MCFVLVLVVVLVVVVVVIAIVVPGCGVRLACSLFWLFSSSHHC